MHQESNESPAEGRTDISYFAVTGQGGRPYNEDYHGHSFCDNTATFVVADGVGGQAGGALASAIVVEMIRRHARSLSRDEMLKGYEAIAHQILMMQQQRPEYRKMGATVAELRIDLARQMAVWGHLGDSRIYWIRNHEIMKMTHDHSVVQSLVTAGLITKHEALTHPRKNILLGAFGVAGDVAPEVLDPPVYLAAGDAFLLCTDGMWNCVSEQDILKTLESSSTVEEWIRKLESCASAALLNDKDNYTAIGVWITSSTDQTVRMI